MKNEVQLRNAILPVKNNLGCSPWRRLVFIISFVTTAAWLAISPTGWACDEVCANGGFNTGFGDAPLYNITTGVDNTAVGFWPLLSSTSGNDNTAIGFEALLE